MHIPNRASAYSSALQREIARRSARNVAPSRAKPARNLSTTTAIPRPYTFHIGTSWAGKVTHDVDKKLKVPFPADGLIGSWRDKMLSRPKSVKSVDAGEDFFFVQESYTFMSAPTLNRCGTVQYVPKLVMSPPYLTPLLFLFLVMEGISFGVADGVGGWVESGVDPSLFSQALMYHAHRYSRNAWAGEPEIDPTLDYEEREQIEGWEMTPYECLDLAYHGVLREKMVQAGSSTACIISLNAANGLLRSANLGDSGFAIIRTSSIFYRQRTQTHFFNCPKQLTKLPTNAGRKFSRACVDSPSDADTFQTKLRDGDIVVAYTDGFSDNVFPSEMATICRLVARAGGTEDGMAQTMADRMVEYSQQCMRSKTRVSPFERDAARQGMFFRGGKEDDVTVVVGLVRETS